MEAVNSDAPELHIAETEESEVQDDGTDEDEDLEYSPYPCPISEHDIPLLTWLSDIGRITNLDYIKLMMVPIFLSFNIVVIRSFLGCFIAGTTSYEQLAQAILMYCMSFGMLVLAGYIENGYATTFLRILRSIFTDKTISTLAYLLQQVYEHLQEDQRRKEDNIDKQSWFETEETDSDQQDESMPLESDQSKDTKLHEKPKILQTDTSDSIDASSTVIAASSAVSTPMPETVSQKDKTLVTESGGSELLSVCRANNCSISEESSSDIRRRKISPEERNLPVSSAEDVTRK